MGEVSFWVGSGDGVELHSGVELNSGVESGEPGTEKRSCLGVLVALEHRVADCADLTVDRVR